MESAPLLNPGGEATPRANRGAPVSRVGLALAVLAAVAFFAVVATSSNVATVVSGSPGRHTHGRATDHDGGKHTDLKMLEQDVDDVIRADLGKSINLTAACRAEVIGHQRIFVNGLEQMFSNGCGGSNFEPMQLRDDILEEQGPPKSTADCQQEFMDHVFVKTFARVYEWMCVAEDKTLKMVMGFKATVPAADFDKTVLDAIALALSSTEGMKTDQVVAVDAMSVQDAKGVELYKKLLDKGKKTMLGDDPSVVVILEVKGEDMATSLLAVTHFSHTAEQGVIASEIQKQSIATILGSVVLGWLPPHVPVPDHFNRFSDYVTATLGSAVTGQ